MIFSPQQDKALTAALAWLRAKNQPVFSVFGYAGTGKTTIAQELAAGADGRVLFAAYTGKAASVMRSRGCPDATTIHRLIYKPAGRSSKLLVELQQKLESLLREHRVQCDEAQMELEESAQIAQLRKTLRDEGERVNRPNFILNPDSPVHQCALVVIDECSMVDPQMGADLLSFGKPIMVLGDPAQLPPVKGEGFFTSRKPDVMLTEIHRQARDNPIINLATRAREGLELQLGDYGGSRVLPVGSFRKDMARNASQVIVGRNATRANFNSNHRKHLLGFEGPLPQRGDKLVCLRNNHELGLLNGGLWEVEEASAPVDASVTLQLRSEDGVNQIVEAHSRLFTGEEIPYWEQKDYESFAYGYALTCHKSQGSQWQDVLIFDESRSFREHANKWLYTALTRAANSVTVIKT